MSRRWLVIHLLALLVCLLGSISKASENRAPALRPLPSVTSQPAWCESKGRSDVEHFADLIPADLQSYTPTCIRFASFSESQTNAAAGVTEATCGRRCGVLARWVKLHEAHQPTGFIDVNSYWDTRHFAVTTVNLLANLPNDFQYFQFANFDSALGSDTHDWNGFYTELNLRKAICKDNPYLTHLDATVQYADGSAPHGNLRLGVRWRTHDTAGCLGAFVKDTLKLRYSVNFHFLETDGTGWQIEHFYRRDFLEGDVYVAAFCDHNIDNNAQSSSWVTEHQIGVRLIDPLYVVAEYRYNSFLPVGARSGWGVGLEYVIRFQ